MALGEFIQPPYLPCFGKGAPKMFAMLFLQEFVFFENYKNLASSSCKEMST